MSLPPLALCLMAWRQLLRDRRAGEVRILFWALVIAVAASTAIGCFSAGLQASMHRHAGDFLAADLVLRGTASSTEKQVDSGVKLGLRHAAAVEFSSMIVHGDAMQLSSVKAVSNNYPLRGQLLSTLHDRDTSKQTEGPSPGEAWAERRLLDALNLKLGDAVQIGKYSLRLTRILVSEPDRAGNLYSFTPRVMMNLQDLAATGVVQPGSRVHYSDFWSGDTRQLDSYRQRIQGSLQANQELQSPGDGNRQTDSALGKADSYLNLASLAAVLLAGAAVALSASRFSRKRYDDSALLRCLGLSRQSALMLYGLELLFLGIGTCLVGVLLGWLGQFGLFYLLRGLLDIRVESTDSAPLLGGAATGLIALLGFALPPLAALGNIPPLRVLRRDLLPMAGKSWLAYSIALAALTAILWMLSTDWRLTLTLAGGILTSFVLLGLLLLAGLRGLRILLTTAPLPWRLGLGQLLHNPLMAVGQALAFSFILLVMALIALLRTELVDQWQDQLPEDASNYFAFNIAPWQVDSFRNALPSTIRHVAPFYPMIAGRLVRANGRPIAALTDADSRAGRAGRRDLNLTWTVDLPEGNRITDGSWWNGEVVTGHPPGVSVEKELADSLGVTVGDSLDFIIAGATYSTRITSLRHINWETMQPNFFVIFQSGALQGQSATYLTSFYIPPGHEREIVTLSRRYPTVTLLEIQSILDQLRSILGQVSLAVEYILVFVLAASLAVLSAGLQVTLDERIRQGALLRALGAEQRILTRTYLIEFTLLGAVSGLLAAVGCEILCAILYHFIFELAWRFHPWLLLLPVFGAVLIGAAGVLGTHRAVRASPLLLLREG